MFHLLVSIALVLLISSAPLSAQVSQPASANFTHLEPPSSGNYKPPRLSRNSILDDPGIERAISHLYTGDFTGFQTELHTQAEAGNPAAQLMLGTQYIPKETFAPPDISEMQGGKDPSPPKIIPAKDNSPLSKVFSPSYSEALRWLTLASAHGSGEASELVAQIILRMLDGHQASTYTAIDAAQYRRLAVQQGYDLEDASVRCLLLTQTPQPLTCIDVHIPGSCPTRDEMQELRAIGLTGTLEPQGAAGGSMTTINGHPGGPPARAFVIIDHNVDTEQRLPLPRHASTIYVQQTKGWLALPKDGPVLSRDIVLTPGEDALNAVMVYVQDIDGSHSGAYCTRSIGAFPH